MFYAGIGAVTTPRQTLDFMRLLGLALGDRGYILRSGGAVGADTAFYQGATAHDGPTPEVFRPEHATEAALEMASKIHPAWECCDEYAKKLHGRNCMILLGKNLDSPVKFVICWTPSGRVVGGTAMGIRIAGINNIPVYNLGAPQWVAHYTLLDFLLPKTPGKAG